MLNASLPANRLRVLWLIALLLPFAGNAGSKPSSEHELRNWQVQLTSLPESERARIVQAMRDLAGMPLEQQQRLRAQFDSLDRLYRDGWRMGPTVGHYWPGLQPLLGMVPVEQRQPLKAWLWSLNPKDLERLVRLAQRTPPEQRDTLRQALLNLPVSQRRAWLYNASGG